MTLDIAGIIPKGVSVFDLILGLRRCKERHERSVNSDAHIHKCGGMLYRSGLNVFSGLNVSTVCPDSPERSLNAPANSLNALNVMLS